ncbi:MAG: hypothetical protein ABJF10_25450 [Chthoniobacter sp.]|uniref:hypothetical protein n=1 Tax=Chthoniobacter sp. TaxID=2510640 RepID=UPI0032A607FB
MNRGSLRLSHALLHFAIIAATAVCYPALAASHRGLAHSALVTINDGDEHGD